MKAKKTSVPRVKKKKGKKLHRKFESLFGIWADRKDMQDSVKWVQELRAGRHKIELGS